MVSQIVKKSFFAQSGCYSCAADVHITEWVFEIAHVCECIYYIYSTLWALMAGSYTEQRRQWKWNNESFTGTYVDAI